jgi:integrase
MARKPRHVDRDRLLDDNAEPHVMEMDKPGLNWTPVRFAPLRYQVVSKPFRKQTLTPEAIEAFVTETVKDSSFIACELEGFSFLVDEEGELKLAIVAPHAPLEMVDAVDGRVPPVSEAIAVRIAAAWAQMETRFRAAHRLGDCRVLARSGSPVAEHFTAVVPDAFAAFKIIDWRNGVAESGAAAQRSIARAWNANASKIQGWPTQLLTEPPLKAADGPDWSQFPQGLRRDVDSYLASLTKKRKRADGQRIRPCKAPSIRTRRAELIAVTKMAVRIGTPIETLTSLQALLDPDLVERVIDAYWEQNGEVPSSFTIDLGYKLLSIARSTNCLDDAGITRLDEIRVDLEDERQPGMTPKNLDLVRKVLTEGVWTQVASLPWVLMKEARLLQTHAPVRAAVAAQMAVAIGILTVAPIRLSNLAAIRLDEHLLKPGGFGSPFWLMFRPHEVKNAVALDFPFSKELTNLIDEYIHDFRPALMRGFNTPLLFPGIAGDCKCSKMFSTQITNRILKATGLRLTVHQFRHAAAAIYLKAKPGHYETVRQLLAHKSIKTTINFYCALGTIAATEQFAKIVSREIRFESEDA